MKAPDLPASVLLALLAAGAVGVYVWRSGGLNKAASGAGAAAVGAAGAAVSGAVGAIGSAVNLPTPDQTTTDPAVARWLIDNAGFYQASRWSGAPALVRALTMAQGTGSEPPPGPIRQAFAQATGNYDETDRLTRRYPAPYIDRSGDYSDPNAYNLPL